MKGRIKRVIRVGDTERVFAWIPTWVQHPDDHEQLVWLEPITRTLLYTTYEGNGYKYTP